MPIGQSPHFRRTYKLESIKNGFDSGARRKYVSLCLPGLGPAVPNWKFRERGEAVHDPFQFLNADTAKRGESYRAASFQGLALCITRPGLSGPHKRFPQASNVRN